MLESDRRVFRCLIVGAVASACRGSRSVPMLRISSLTMLRLITSVQRSFPVGLLTTQYDSARRIMPRIGVVTQILLKAELSVQVSPRAFEDKRDTWISDVFG